MVVSYVSFADIELLRHVRVHHPGRDKDDPELRHVLALRPDGPNHGRRRRVANVS
jgi:hypothetical protein